MKTFEDELLAELRAVVSEREVAPAPRRGFVARHRVVVGLAACATLAVAGTVAVSVVGGDQTTSPAYSVTKTPDGKVTVTIYRGADDPEGLERRLAQAGVAANATFLPGWMNCQYPRGEVFGAQYSLEIVSDGSTTTLTVDPEELRGATLVIEKYTYDQARGGLQRIDTSSKFIKTDTLKPCAAK